MRLLVVGKYMRDGKPLARHGPRRIGVDQNVACAFIRSEEEERPVRAHGEVVDPRQAQRNSFEVFTRLVEDLDTSRLRVSDVDAPVRTETRIPRSSELAGSIALTSESGNDMAVAVEKGDARGGDVSDHERPVRPNIDA